ncbi:MAG: retropepsin-like aspartic protease [Pirellulaceae bacterium]
MVGRLDSFSLSWAALALACFLTLNGWAQDYRVPIAGNSPQVIMSITDRRDRDDSVWTATNSSVTVGNQLPKNATPHYAVATYDTGSVAHILGFDDYQAFNVAGAGREGSNFTPVLGVGGGIVNLRNSDPLGIFISGMQARTSSTPLTGDPIRLGGQFNVSVLSAPSDSSLPSIVGTALSGEYTTVIRHSDLQIVQMDDRTVRTPALDIELPGTVDPPARRLAMTYSFGLAGSSPPAFFPNLLNLDINDLANDPSTPSAGGMFFLKANAKNNGFSQSNVDMLFDTGAQASIVSDQVAATLGFDVSNDEPDFVVRVAGVSGETQEVPGFIADEFHLNGTGGGLTLQNVPLVVLNITDPRDGFNILPGLIGMNLFGDRDLTINPQQGNSYLGISDPVTTTHQWTADSGTWSIGANWTAPGTPRQLWIANLANDDNPSGKVATVSEDSSVHSINVSGTVGPMTIDVQKNNTLTTFGSVIIETGGRVGLNQSTLDTLAVELRGGSLMGSGTVLGEVLSQGLIDPDGILKFEANIDQLSEGTLRLGMRGTDNSNPNDPQHDQIVVGSNITVGGRLEMAFENGFRPQVGQSHSIELISAGEALAGQFNSVSLDGYELNVEDTIDFRGSFNDAVNGFFFTFQYSQHGLSLDGFQAAPGDANGDMVFDSSDLVTVFTAGEYEDTLIGNSTWETGDWNGDREFNTNDLVAAFTFGGYEGDSVGVRPVPEPTAGWLVSIGIAVFLLVRRRTT